MFGKLASKFREWKIARYKKKKVISSITFQKKYYFMKFTINVNDDINNQESIKEYEMVVPARAAFYARLKAKHAVKKKIELGFKRCHHMSDEEVEEFFISKEEYEKSLKSNND